MQQERRVLGVGATIPLVCSWGRGLCSGLGEERLSYKAWKWGTLTLWPVLERGARHAQGF